MNDQSAGRHPRRDPDDGKKRRGLYIVGAGLLLVLGMAAYWQIDAWMERRALVMASPDRVPNDPELVRLAMSLGKAAYDKNCVRCHGANMEGNQAKGAPSLVDALWLYDQGHVSDIERTVMYGIRSGVGKARNVTDMPGLGVIKQLTPDDVRDVETYILSLSTKQTDTAAIARGSKIFQDKGNCYDCHGRDADGNPDYGSPKLSDNEWLYGGDRDTVYRSIYDGRHGVCPAWIGKLDFATIRGVAVYIYEKSRPKTAARKPAVASPTPKAAG